MPSIRTMCPYCIYPVDLDPPEILLLPAPAPAACGSYAYYGGSCQRVTVAAVSRDAFTLLVNAGVRVEHGDPTPDSPPARPPTVDDLIDFHRLLETGDWFSRLR
jgi:hypothetical protein